MEKLVYVLWKRPDLTPNGFKTKLLGDVADRFRQLGARDVSINVADELVEPAQKARLTTLDPTVDGVIGFWVDLADDRGPFEEALATATARLAGYLVVESVPLINRTHTAARGERTPGINMIALIEKPDHLTYDEWLEHWHGHHKKVALETQCVYAYVRNVVVRALTKNAPPWLGIVEEGFPAEAVTDPMRWYCADGSKDKFDENFGRMMESVGAFLDVKRVESHPMSEYRL